MDRIATCWNSNLWGDGSIKKALGGVCIYPMLITDIHPNKFTKKNNVINVANHKTDGELTEPSMELAKKY